MNACDAPSICRSSHGGVSFRAYGILLRIKTLEGSDGSDLRVHYDEKTKRSQPAKDIISTKKLENYDATKYLW